jgi:uncharacterized protein (DUF1778 family)
VTIRKANIRRRLHSGVRKTILSYYSAEEAQKIVAAAKKEGVTISNFVASAALTAADAVMVQKKSK